MFVLIKNIILLFLCSLISGNIDFLDQELVRIGEKQIMVRDFMERAEYVPRPMYCNGSSTLDKRIILNTLIAEKLFANQNIDGNIPTSIGDYLNGRKEQKMRELLRSKIIDSSDIDRNSLNHWYNLSNIKYDFVYIGLIEDKYITEIVRLSQSKPQFRLKNYLNSSGIQAPERNDVTIFNVDSDVIREKLFLNKLEVGDVVGPIKYDSNLTIFLQIEDIHIENDLNPITRQEKSNQVSYLIDSHLENRAFTNYLNEIMEGLKFNLHQDAFGDFVNIVKSDIQFNIDQTIYNKKMLILDNKEFSINEVLDWIKLHPLVFRGGHYADLSYPEQLKLALVDLVRDLELNKKSYNLDLDQHPVVIKEVEMWEENYLALEYRDQIIEDQKYNNNMGVDNRLNEHFLFLSNKFSDSIFINTSLLDKIKISSIDMVTYKTNSAYNALVPMFPILTDHHQFDFGQQLTMESN